LLFLAYRDPLNPFGGGGDLYISEIAKGCARRGHEVTFVSGNFPGALREEWKEGIRIVRCGNGITLAARVFVLYLKQLRKRFDVVVEEVIGGPRIPFFAALYMSERIIGIIQQKHKEIFRYQLPSPLHQILTLMEPMLSLIYRNRTIIVNSRRTRNELRGIGFDLDHMQVVNPGINERFLTVDSRGARERLDQVICIAKARRYKLIDHAILAMKEVCKTIPTCKLVIAGKKSDVDRGYELYLRKLTNGLGLSRNIVFRNDIEETEKIRLLSQSRALVLPSAVEGFGIVVIEANACGTPAVVSDRVPSDAAKDGYNAIVVKCGEIDSLSAGIVDLLSDEAKWTTMSENAIKWARTFSWNRTVNQFLDNLGRPLFRREPGQEATQAVAAPQSKQESSIHWN
jgi:glycosyltransferase involved in cell wall biosynthesis